MSTTVSTIVVALVATIGTGAVLYLLAGGAEHEEAA